MKMLKRLILGLCAVCTTSVVSAAETVGERLDAASATVYSLGNFALVAVGAAGIFILFTGIWGLKKYADDARSNPLAKPMIYLVAGGLMTGFAAFQSTLSNTTTGTDSSTTTGSFTATDNSGTP
jgi:hypothetical protein